MKNRSYHHQHRSRNKAIVICENVRHLTELVTDDMSPSRASRQGSLPKSPHSAAKYIQSSRVYSTRSNSAACVYSTSAARRKVGARLEGKWARGPGRRAGRNQGSATRKWAFSRHSLRETPREGGAVRARSLTAPLHRQSEGDPAERPRCKQGARKRSPSSPAWREVKDGSPDVFCS